MDDRHRCSQAQLDAVIFNAANSPFLRPDRRDRRCAEAARGDLTWMCLTCQLRQLLYGPLCGRCGICHGEEEAC